MPDFSLEENSEKLLLRAIHRAGYLLITEPDTENSEVYTLIGHGCVIKGLNAFVIFKGVHN
jgi:hypothetical protein